MNIHCILCKESRILTSEELKETAQFVRNNELNSESYEDYMSTKIGWKCKGVDNKSELLKKHKFMIDEEDRKEIGEVAIGIKSVIGEQVKHITRRANINNSVDEIKREADKKIAELTKEAIEIQEKLPAIEEAIKNGREKLFELVGDDREELWIKKKD